MNNSFDTSKITATKTTGYLVDGIAKPFKFRYKAVAAAIKLWGGHGGHLVKVHDWQDFQGNHYLDGKTCLKADKVLLELRKTRKLLRIRLKIDQLKAKARLYR